MDKKERLEEKFRESLYNFESKPGKDSWERIARELECKKAGKEQGLWIPSGEKTAKTRQLYKFYRVTALILLLLAIGGTRFLTGPGTTETRAPYLAYTGKNRESQKAKPIHIYTLTQKNTGHHIQKEMLSIRNAVNTPLRKRKQKGDTRIQSRRTTVQHEGLPTTVRQKDSTFSLYPSYSVTLSPPASGLVIACATKKQAPRKSFFRDWRLGMGGSSVGLSGISNPLSGGTNHFVSNNPEPELPCQKNRPSSLPLRPDQSKSTKIKHGIPLSFGISLSHPLAERCFLNTGLTYTYLPSRWKYKYTSGTAGRQRLHLIGIPLSVSYRLNDWERPYCYATAGILAEVNVAGKIHTSHTTYHIRIPGLLWTANARIGLSYPLLRFLSLYGEAGLCYYFKYKSPIETIRSKDPFKVSGQIGLRLNF